MNVTGIIAEYNPFHLGHAYHLEQARRLTDADYLIVVMSGNFVQRGEPALTDKYLRTRMALENGADLVLELPVLYSTAGSEDFAAGSVALLDKLGIVNALCFGSECGELDSIQSASRLLENLSPETQTQIRRHLKEGLSYPAAVARAVRSASGELSDIGELFSSPNNLLAIEYCRALNRFSSALRPVTIKRLGNYHDTSIGTIDDTVRFSSASALRNCFASMELSEALNQIRNSVPSSVLHLMEQEGGISYPVFADDFSDTLFLRLLEHDQETLTGFLDVSEDMAGRICNALPTAHSFSRLAETVKCKSYTRLRINRALLHCLLGVTDRDILEAKTSGYIHYGRILGFRESARSLLRELNRHSLIPLIYQPAQDEERICPEGRRSFALDVFSSELYRMTAQRKFGISSPGEYCRYLIRV